MSAAADMLALLTPLGVYDPEGVFFAGELEAMGAALDGVAALLDTAGTENIPLTAQNVGLERIAALLPRRPAADTAEDMGRALAALLRISGDSFTPAAIQDTLSGCGTACRVTEGEPGYVAVSFPGVAGIPDEFDRMRQIIEEILPAHVLAEYKFRYLTWAELERRLPTWQSLEALGLTWEELEKYVEPEGTQGT